MIRGPVPGPRGAASASCAGCARSTSSILAARAFCQRGRRNRRRAGGSQNMSGFEGRGGTQLRCQVLDPETCGSRFALKPLVSSASGLLFYASTASDSIPAWRRENRSTKWLGDLHRRLQMASASQACAKLVRSSVQQCTKENQRLQSTIHMLEFYLERSIVAFVMQM